MVASALADGRTLSQVRSARFRDLVPPGATLDLDAEAQGDGSVTFGARAGGRVVVNGRLAFGPPQEGGFAHFTVASRPARNVPPLERLLLHRGPARLVRAWSHDYSS